MKTSRAVLTEGSVGRHLVYMTVPMIFGIATIMLQTFVDMWFVSKIGDMPLAALSFAFPVIMVVTSLAIGLGAGTSSVIARAIGANDYELARRLSTDGLILSFLLTVLISIFGYCYTDILFIALGAPSELILIISGYMNILYFAVPFLVVGMVGTTAMRATGDTRLSGMLMIGGSLLNVILDPILIFGFGPIPSLGLLGAAWAALIARTFIFIFVIYFMKTESNLLSFKIPDRFQILNSWKKILHVGIPAAGTNAIIPVVTGVITAMLAKFGPEAVAGFGVASRIESVVLVLFYALSAVIGPFVGQNITSGRFDRIHKSLWLCTVFCLIFGLVIAGFLFLAADWLPSLFSYNYKVTRVTKIFLVVVPISYGAYGMVMVMNASFNGMGKPIPAVIISVLRMVGIYIPLAFFLQSYYQILGIFLAYMIANLVSGAIAYFWAISTLNINKSNMH